MQTKTFKKQIGIVGVDSGQLMICDFINDDFDSPAKETDFSYSNVCRKTLSEEQAGCIPFSKGHEGQAVAFSSGFGDGTYPVIAHYKDFGDDQPDIRIYKVEILLID